jgi:alkyl hydroperoxide reductase subunit AhpC
MAAFRSRTFLRRIGQKALTFQLPVIVADKVSYVHPDTFLGRWLVLSFVTGLEHVDVQLWNRHGKELAQREITLLLAPTEATVLDWRKPLIQEQAYYTIVCDPLRRLERLYGGRTREVAGHSRTFVIDPKGSLRFHLLHSITEQGMSVLTEALRVHQERVGHNVPTIMKEQHDLQATPWESSKNLSNCSNILLAM